ncbi:ABC transporter permease [Streptomyces kaniharaensis]|uniref:ABC transporter permease n=1 Tax=Streptomyces kaniharaensis TaxID=212423 RepID=A0A6N7KRN2_9ACTN|nr:ABC transporter permease [Streptomyces kaniharaensis]MQS13249.1 ABC transporter permease [Streptomyces kaniharaensis]
MTVPTATGPQSTAVRRLTALGRAETTLLLRNRTALFTALLLPLLMLAGRRNMLKQQAESHPGLDVDSLLIIGTIGGILAFVVYYNLTAAYVGRRNQLVLKRLRTGEAGDVEILAGTAVPSVSLALLMTAVVAVGGAVVLDLSTPVNPLLLAAGLLLSIGTLIALAALSSAFTKTVETAGITTLPILLISQFGSGLFIPLEVMPDRLADFCRMLPTTPGFQLIHLGWTGTDGSAAATGFAGTWSTAAPHLVTGAVWLGLAVWGAVRYFRWEPRR